MDVGPGQIQAVSESPDVAFYCAGNVPLDGTATGAAVRGSQAASAQVLGIPILRNSKASIQL